MARESDGAANVERSVPLSCTDVQDAVRLQVRALRTILNSP